MTKFTLSNKLSICCNAKMKLDVPNSDIGICTNCGGLAFDKAKEHRLSNNRYQKFKKIADDGLYNNEWNSKKKIEYRFFTPRKRNSY
tara:strand:- start:454 stop:714 length:261 start_codon:yes stop_codon:yes gene_type:complete